MKSIATLLITAVLAKDEKISIDLKQTVGEGKMTYMADRTLNKRSSDKPKTMWSSLFGATDTRTEFDHRVDAYVKNEQKKTQKKLRSSSSMKLRATTIDHDLNYAVVLPMFLGEVRMGTK